jgi:hypothetical protein
MNKEEFLNFLNNSQTDLEAAEKHAEAFIKKLSEELYSLVFSYYPEFAPYSKTVSKKVKEFACQCAQQVFENFDTVVYYQINNKPYTSKSSVPKPKTLAESEKELNELIELFPDDKEYAIQVHTESFNETNRTELFRQQTHNKVKEVLVKFYEETILDLKSDYLRMLDNYTYYLATFPFIDHFYETVG